MIGRDSEYDLTRIIVRPLYFGLFSNVIIPMLALLAVYYIHNDRGWAPLVSENTANALFYLLAGLALLHVGAVIWWRGRLFNAPMIRRKETFEQDFSDEYLRRSKPLFIAIAAVSLYGLVYFFATGRFNETIMFVVFSFLVFQVVRPRYGLVQKLIERQEKLANEGRFWQ